MKFFRWLNIIVFLAFLLSACSAGGGGLPIPIPSVPTETSLPQPLVTVNAAPSVDAAMASYLDAFKADDYNKMYSMLTKAAQDTISRIQANRIYLAISVFGVILTIILIVYFIARYFI